MDALTDAEFAQRMADLGLAAWPARLAVAVSGGADSMALAVLAARWAQAQAITLYAFTVNHGLRPEAAEEARQVQQWLAAQQVACEILTPATPITGANLQEKARNARYQAMAKACARNHCAHLLVAHHADDQLETLLMRLVRASGVEGLAGMRPLSHHDGLILLRPLLSVPKDRLVATLHMLRQPWIEDPSNHSDAFLRNRIRPLAASLRAEGLSAERVTLLTRQLAATSDYLAEQVNHWIATHVEDLPAGEVAMKLLLWQDVPPELGWRALRQLVMQVGKTDRPPRAEKLMPLFLALHTGNLRKRRTLGGCLFIPQGKYNRLMITPEP